ncbi:hypothetical protein NUACC21_37890 [Scytonema sp. NUACC21]
MLLDGLDEVRETDSKRVLEQIKEFTTQFPKNQFVITCRIAAREYTFVQFTEVEVADFDSQQIASFANKLVWLIYLFLNNFYVNSCKKYNTQFLIKQC